MPQVVVGVMGPGEAATNADRLLAGRLGELIADRGWVTLTGGRPVGVMEAALRGAKGRGGLTVGVLPQDAFEFASEAADIRILTGLGEARNVINVLSSQVIFVCGMSSGTASEVALALKTQRQTILLNPTPEGAQFWGSLKSPFLHVAATAEEAVEFAAGLIQRSTDK